MKVTPSIFSGGVKELTSVGLNGVVEVYGYDKEGKADGVSTGNRYCR